MKVYLASFFADKDKIKSYAEELESYGITCTSRWCNETVPHMVSIKDVPDEYHRETAVADVDDIVAANYLVLFTASQEHLTKLGTELLARGGRHVELGLFLGLMLSELRNKGWTSRKLIVCGNRENIFHWLDGTGITKNLPAIITMKTWDEVYSFLQNESIPF